MMLGYFHTWWKGSYSHTRDQQRAMRKVDHLENSTRLRDHASDRGKRCLKAELCQGYASRLLGRSKVSRVSSAWHQTRPRDNLLLLHRRLHKPTSSLVCPHSQSSPSARHSDNLQTTSSPSTLCAASTTPRGVARDLFALRPSALSLTLQAHTQHSVIQSDLFAFAPSSTTSHSTNPPILS
jgi:hypothetical protein